LPFPRSVAAKKTQQQRTTFKIGSILKSSMGQTEEHVKELLKTIEKRNKQINALLYVNKNAVDDAKAVDKKLATGTAGKLAGKVIAVKANISVKDMPITCASKTLEHYKGAFDADVIKKIKEQDGVIIGIANMDEFACGISGESSAFGPTLNPAAPGRVPGGSSSGSASAVAAGFCDMALGSDTGGSIRNPASHCGVVGIKPSYGKVSRFGLIDLSMSLDQIGPLARTVKDAQLLLSAIAGYSKYDAATLETSQKKKKGKLKIGISSDFEKLCTDKRIYKKVMEAAETFAGKQNADIVNVKLKHVDLAIQTYYPLVYVEFFSGTRKFDGRKYGKKIEDSCGEEVLRRILGGREISKAEHQGRYYRKALAVKQLISRDFGAAFEKADILMLPTTPMLPHRLGTKMKDPKAMYAYDAFTIPANLTGICAGVVPAGVIENIPVGLQVMAPSMQENVLTEVMMAVEKHA
jgi:aspartyl-tRNA(Asn)/glutamyl-tRNA(Gln) amidotransferase subunit A